MSERSRHLAHDPSRPPAQGFCGSGAPWCDHSNDLFHRYSFSVFGSEAQCPNLPPPPPPSPPPPTPSPPPPSPPPPSPEDPPSSPSPPPPDYPIDCDELEVLRGRKELGDVGLEFCTEVKEVNGFVAARDCASFFKRRWDGVISPCAVEDDGVCRGWTNVNCNPPSTPPPPSPPPPSPSPPPKSPPTSPPKPFLPTMSRNDDFPPTPPTAVRNEGITWQQPACYVDAHGQSHCVVLPDGSTIDDPALQPRLESDWGAPLINRPPAAPPSPPSVNDLLAPNRNPGLSANLIPSVGRRLDLDGKPIPLLDENSKPIPMTRLASEGSYSAEISATGK